MINDPRIRSSGWKRLRLLILERDRYRCQVGGPGCQATATEADHIVPPSEGGSFWDPSNLRGSCKPCNARRGGQLGGRRFRYHQPQPWLETRL